MSYVHRCLIVEASIAEQARQLAVALAGEPAAGMWLTALSPTGEAPATHYVSSGMIEDTFVGILESAAVLAAAAGISEAEAEALLAQADISQAEPFEAFERLGLQIIRAEE